MNYDDNKLQGQNSQIDGEGVSKISPVTHPYALPKFDFDDGLQGHLRFDSLVENEAVLAIPSHEENQWIEDFSQGTGDLVFSSSAPESCPILRSNNVWSEAASSESVEMLLKSVGQEETVTIVEETDACQNLDSVAEQMASHFKQDGNTMNAVNSDVTFGQEETIVGETVTCQNLGTVADDQMPSHSKQDENTTSVVNSDITYEQEETVTIAEKTDACPKLGTVAEQIAPHSKQDGHTIIAVNSDVTYGQEEMIVEETVTCQNLGTVADDQMPSHSKEDENAMSVVNSDVTYEQEEIVTIVKETDACPKLDTVAEQLASHSKQDEHALSAVNSDVTFGQEETIVVETGTCQNLGTVADDQMPSHSKQDEKTISVVNSDATYEQEETAAIVSTVTEQMASHSKQDENTKDTVDSAVTYGQEETVTIVKKFACEKLGTVGEQMASDFKQDENTINAGDSYITYEQEETITLVKETVACEKLSTDENPMDAVNSDVTSGQEDCVPVDQKLGTEAEQMTSHFKQDENTMNAVDSDVTFEQEETVTVDEETVTCQKLGNIAEEIASHFKEDENTVNGVVSDIRVGQGETVMIVEETVACQKLGTVVEQMNSQFREDENTMNAVDSDVTYEPQETVNIVQKIVACEKLDTVVEQVSSHFKHDETITIVKETVACEKLSTDENPMDVVDSDVTFGQKDSVAIDQKLGTEAEQMTSHFRQDENTTNAVDSDVTYEPQETVTIVQRIVACEKLDTVGEQMLFHFKHDENTVNAMDSNVTVGQEEKAIIVEETVASQKLGTLGEQMASHFKRDENTVDATDPDVTLLSDKVADHGSLHCDIEGVSNFLGGVESSIHGESHMLSSNALVETCVVDEAEDNCGQRHGEEYLTEVNNLAEFRVNSMQDPSGSNMHTEVQDSTSQNIIANTVSLNNDESADMVTDVGLQGSDRQLDTKVSISNNQPTTMSDIYDKASEITDKMNPHLDTEQHSVDHTFPVVGTLNTASESEQSGEIMKVTTAIIQAEKADKTPQISENLPCNLELFPAMNVSTSKQSSGADATDTPSNHGAIRKDHKSASSEVSDPNVSMLAIHSCNTLNESKGGESSVKSVDTADKVAKQSDVAKDDQGFTFEVNLSSGVVGKCDKDKQLFSSTRSFKSFKEPNIVVETSCASSQALNLEITPGGSINTSVRKRGRPPGKVSEKQSAKKKKSLKEKNPFMQSEKGGNLRFEEVKLHEKFKHSGIVSYSGGPITTPNLPDLNTSASPSALLRQPFSDIQQMQLRSQIYVYGSLISEAAPDEAHMANAFGTSDGGKNTWEPVWRARVEKLQGVKSNLGKSDKPMQSHSGSNPAEQSSTKKTPPPVVNPMIPLSSPLWNKSTPFHGLQSPVIPTNSVFDYHQPQTPNHPFQTPASRNVAKSNSFQPSHSSFPAPWITVSQSSNIPVTAKMTPVEKSVPHVSSGEKHPLTSTTTVHHSGPCSSVEPYTLPEMRKTILPAGQKNAESKSRKRKKSSVSDNLIQIPLLSQARVESVPAPVPAVVPSHLSTSVVVSTTPYFRSSENNASIVTTASPFGVSTPQLFGLKGNDASYLSTSAGVSTPQFFGSKANDARIVTMASPTYLTDQLKSLESSVKQKSNLPEDSLIKAEETKQQAENAAEHAGSAVSHSESVWAKLNEQKGFGLTEEIEAKLASAAVAIAAAAAVAKAAAAAAQVASNAAFQAKLMADEAWNSRKVDEISSNNALSTSNMGKIMGLATEEGNSSGSILFAAKEASKKRIEAASFASKRAENLDAIIKAAELAASAVSQAGSIVAMGDPPSLRKLVEFGPVDYWKISPEKVNEETPNISITEKVPNVSDRYANEEQSTIITSRAMSPLPREIFKDSNLKGMESLPTSFTSSEKDSRAQSDSRGVNLDKTIGVVPELKSGSRLSSIIAQGDYNNGMEMSKRTNISEGCSVEVKKEGCGFKEAWFSAIVLSIENGKAFVSFSGSKSELKEWVALEGESGNAPRIRVAKFEADKQLQGTRKRRRSLTGDCVWSIGDRVDVWIQECWREGIVTDKNRIDSTTLTVHFPAEGETSVVRAWHLRPTLIWKDGEWIESSRQNDPLQKMGDTPKEKRIKFDGPSIEGSNKDNISGPEELQLLPLTDNENLFNIGNDIKKDNRQNAPRTVRSGLQKEGPRVVFGVPEPGRKKKFMEVSKHYVTESSNKTDTLREKHRMPKNDAKDKHQNELKTKVPKPRKQVSSLGRTLPQREKFQSSSIPTKNEGRRSSSTDESEPEPQKRSDFRSVSSSRTAQDSSAFSRNFTSNSRSERVKKGNTAMIGKWGKVESTNNLDGEKHSGDAAEPRRSNRRIQPTSRLLEGLQSSLVLPKFPSFARDKGQRSHKRSTPKR